MRRFSTPTVAKRSSNDVRPDRRTIARITTHLFLNYVGPVDNQAVHFDDLPDTGPYLTGMCFPDTQTVFVTNSNPNFFYFEFHPERFPKATQFWIISGIDPQIVSRFNAQIILSAEHIKKSYISPNEKHVKFLPMLKMREMLNSHESVPSLISPHNWQVSDSILDGNLSLFEKRRKIYKLVTGKQ